MNDIERIEKTLHDVIDYLVLTSGEVDKIGALKDIRRTLIDEPIQPLGYQGLNKWYKTSGGHIIYAVSINEFNCYGLRVTNEINKKDHWCNDFALQLNIIECLATESEIKEAILKGCEQHGIVEGATVKIDDSFLKFEIENFNDVYYHVKHNRLFINDIKVFDNGKFAEVVKKEKECKPTDKELLKECETLLTGIFNVSSYISEIDPLLVKLNKHLNNASLIIMTNNPNHDAIDHINYLDSLPDEVLGVCSSCINVNRTIVRSEKGCLTNSENDLFCGDCVKDNRHLEFMRDKYSYLEDSQILEIMDSIKDFETK